MKILKQILLIAVVLVFGIPVTTNAQQSKPKPWDVPAKFKTMKSAIKFDDAAVAAGKALYNKNCASCHGKTGLGDGPKSRGLEAFAGDFSWGG